MGKRVFVTGGAGYIGSHCVAALHEVGYDILTFDNLSTGHAWAVLAGELVRGDLADRPLLERTLSAYGPEAIVHFAASIQVEESVREPLLYYRNNVANTLNVLEAAIATGVRNFIYSSSAAVYGIPARVPVDETAPLLPINPYGATKAMMERIIADLCATGKMRAVALRYFNVAGADLRGRLGQDYPTPTHLITRALRAAQGTLADFAIFGTDYPTPDGTCVRDYIHVDDLARAHVLALERLLATGQTETFNCGYGHGYSVREVLAAVRSVTGIDLAVRAAKRRPGDPPVLVADSRRLQKATGWRPQYDDLTTIIRTAWNWEQTLAQRQARHTSALREPSSAVLS